MKSWRALALMLSLIVASLALRSGAQAQETSAPLKVILRSGDPAGRQALVAENSRLISDYGAFSLWITPKGRAPSRMASSPGVSIHPEFDRLVLRDGTLDTRERADRPPAGAGQGHQLTLVQFIGPVRDEWLDDLGSTGAQIVAYVPYNGYLIWADEDARNQVARRAAERIEYQWHGAYRPEHRLASPLKGLAPDQAADVVVQVLNHPGGERTVQEILAESAEVLRAPSQVLNAIHLTVRAPAALLHAWAARADVLNVEPWGAPQMLDERQGQIMAGHLNVAGTQPEGPGYLDWLKGIGFSTDPNQYPIVDVVDDGFDNGQASAPWHPDFRWQGSFAYPSRVAYARDKTSDGNPHSVGGHGSLNLSIVGGYADVSSPDYQDGDGYHYGLGISPYGRLASTKVFNDQGDWDYWDSWSDLIRGSYRRGARITSHSWGLSVTARYTADAQAFDALTRDADPTVPGNQEMTHVFAAGNDGEMGSRTIWSPGTAKNVITVGASENVRSTGGSPSDADGCGTPNTEADNANEMAAFSSRGPTQDGRIKPDIVAPGTHVQGAASQDLEYDGSGVCALYWPVGQSLYTWSSGTSHSAPAVAGALSLIRHYLTQGIGGVSVSAPSPALLKATLANSTRYLSGAGAGGKLPSNAQGWGLVHLGMAFDGAPRMLVDQSVLLGDSGQVYERSGRVDDPSRPFRVTLAWTDAPGTPVAAAWVNDLDLEVVVGGQTYKGNVFSGATSAGGGVADSVNNVESVFLPAGTSGPFTVRVIAYTIAGDGVPGNTDGTDQDFGLVVYNARDEPDFALGASPSEAQACGASAISYTVHVTGLHGYAGTVSLSHSVPSPDIHPALSPTGGVPSFDAQLSVTTGDSTPVGWYTIAVTGTGARTRAVTVALAVDAVAPTGTVTLIEPTDGVTHVATRPLFAWQALPGARSYRVQVSGSDTFAHPLVDQTTRSTVFALPFDLARDRSYHWRVIAGNGCGSTVSASQTFTTVNQVALFRDTMEDGSGQWNVETVTGTAQWALSDRLIHGGTYAWHMPSDPQVTDARLATAREIAVDETSTLSFWHWYEMESAGSSAGDGGVLEISVDGKPWQDLGATAASGGYSHTVSSGSGNPLAGRVAWSGSSAGWRQVQIELGDYAGSGVRFRFRWGGNAVEATARGWYVDDVWVTSVRPPSKYRAYLSIVRKNR